MKKILYIFLIICLFAPAICQASLASDLKGIILLQVEKNGEAWYIYPDNLQRYYLGRPVDAFTIMRELGLGILHTELEGYLNYKFPTRLAGKIMLDVESNGEAYYVYPKDLKGYYLGRPADAFAIMREKGLGISNQDISEILISPRSQIPYNSDDNTAEAEFSDIELRVFDLVNQHRQEIGAKPLVWNEQIATICRQHSLNIASGAIEVGHGGFAERVAAIKSLMFVNGAAENLAWNNYTDPAQQALTWWLGSPGHKDSLENNLYDMTGVGVAQASDGKYYITQIFINNEEKF